MISCLLFWLSGCFSLIQQLLPETNLLILLCIDPEMFCFNYVLMSRLNLQSLLVWSVWLFPPNMLRSSLIGGIVLSNMDQYGCYHSMHTFFFFIFCLAQGGAIFSINSRMRHSSLILIVSFSLQQQITSSYWSGWGPYSCNYFSFTILDLWCISLLNLLSFISSHSLWKVLLT